MKKTLALILALCALLSLCACSSSSGSSQPETYIPDGEIEVTIAEPETEEDATELGSKTFSFDSFSITLTDNFEEYESEDVDYAVLSDNIGMAVVKEDFASLAQYGIDANTFSAYDYALAAMESVGTYGEVLQAGGYEYFTYDENLTGTDFTYYSAVFKGSDAFWRVSFYTYSNLFDIMIPSFEHWCSSVVVA